MKKHYSFIFKSENWKWYSRCLLKLPNLFIPCDNNCFSLLGVTYGDASHIVLSAVPLVQVMFCTAVSWLPPVLYSWLLRAAGGHLLHYCDFLVQSARQVISHGAISGQRCRSWWWKVAGQREVNGLRWSLRT